MDELEYRAARVDMYTQYWDRIDGWPWVRPLNASANLVQRLGGEMYADSDVHDTGECCCDSM